MLVTELRELLKKYNAEDLRVLITEMYKSMPKKLREEKDIDALLQDIHENLRVKKSKTKEIKQTYIDIEVLESEITQFIDFAYKQYYCAPNIYVHKKDRPKWRFLVKNYINSLQSFPLEGEKGKTATNLLEKLYVLLCYSCGYYVFNTQDPFRSVGIEQSDLFYTVIKRKLGSGINQNSVKSAIELIINNHVGMLTLHSYLIEMLIENLKTPYSKEMAIEQCKALKAELELDGAKQNLLKKSRGYRTFGFDYVYEEKTNTLVEIIFKLHMVLCDYEKGIKYYNQTYLERDEEDSLFILLKFLFECDLKEHWVKEYEKAVEKGVKPRGGLQKTYKYIKENDKMPEYFTY